MGSSVSYMEVRGRVKFGPDGLVAVVAQDVKDGKILMVASMNEEALRFTTLTREAWFWSRSLGKLWHMGETSGNRMKVVGMAADCDGDAVLLEVVPMGPACHTGARSCFDVERIFEMEEPGEADVRNAFEELDAIVKERMLSPVAGSYTNRLLESGLERILRKVGDEASQFIVAVMKAGTERTSQSAKEAAAGLADLIYHTAVAMNCIGSGLPEVAEVLSERKGTKPDEEEKGKL